MGMYWTKVEEDNCEAFRVARTPREELLAYNKVISKLYVIGRNIHQKYYANSYAVIIDDAINHALLKIKTKYNPDFQSSYFSYVSVLIKNYMTDNLIRNPKHLNDTDSIDDIPWLIDEIIDDNQSITQKDDDAKEAILKRFNRLYAKTRQSYGISFKYYEVSGQTTTKENLKKIDNHIKFIKSCIKYIETFGVNVSMQGLVEYCQNENKFSDKVVSNCSIHFFKYSHQPKKSDSRSKSKFINRSADSPMQVFVNDDWTPIDDNESCKYNVRKRLFLNKT